MIEVPIEFEKRFEDHEHTGSDSKAIKIGNTVGTLPIARGGTGEVTANAALNALLPSQTSNANKFLTTNGTDASWSSDPTLVSVLAGEILTAGELVFLYVAGADYTAKGYDQTSNTVYVARAAATSSTYSPNVLGIVVTGANYLGTAVVRIVGKYASLSGMTEGALQYLADYGATTETITQSSNDATATLDTGESLDQVWVPTSSRFDKITLNYGTTGSAEATISIKRGNTAIATVGQTGLGAAADRTWDPSDVRLYKGEILHINISNTGPSGTVPVGYKNGGGSGVYDPQYQGASLGTVADLTGVGESIAANSRLYFKIFEYPDFGKVSASAGTRKIKVGISGESTDLYLQPQMADSLI